MIDVNRLKVYWKKGRDYFQSLFSELSEIERAMTPAEFSKWCQKELGLTVGVLYNASHILKKVDAARVKEQLSAALVAAKEQKMLSQIAKAEEKDRLKAEKKEAARLKKEIAKRERKRRNDRNYRRRKRKKKEEEKLLQIAAE